MAMRAPVSGEPDVCRMRGPRAWTRTRWLGGALERSPMTDPQSRGEICGTTLICRTRPSRGGGQVGPERHGMVMLTAAGIGGRMERWKMQDGGWTAHPRRMTMELDVRLAQDLVLGSSLAGFAIGGAERAPQGLRRTSESCDCRKSRFDSFDTDRHGAISSSDSWQRVMVLLATPCRLL